MKKTLAHQRAAVIARIVANVNDQPVTHIEQEVKTEIAKIAEEVDSQEWPQVLKSFFGQISMMNTCLLKVADICPYFVRLDADSQFPLEEFQRACLYEDVSHVREVLTTL
jgi:hypothetical protein